MLGELSLSSRSVPHSSPGIWWCRAVCHLTAAGRGSPQADTPTKMHGVTVGAWLSAQRCWKAFLQWSSGVSGQSCLQLHIQPSPRYIEIRRLHCVACRTPLLALSTQQGGVCLPGPRASVCRHFCLSQLGEGCLALGGEARDAAEPRSQDRPMAPQHLLLCVTRAKAAER